MREAAAAAASDVAIVESQPLLADAIHGVLAESGIRVRPPQRRFDDAIAAWVDSPPQAAIVDPAVMRPDAPSALGAWAVANETRILLFTRRTDPDYVHLLLCAGARGAVGTSAEPETLLEATRTVLRGGRYVCPAARVGVAERLLEGRRPLYLQLTPRERVVLRLVADGLTLAAAAETLFVSHRTTKTHLENAYRKLGVHDRASAVRALMRIGVLDALEASNGVGRPAIAPGPQDATRTAA